MEIITADDNRYVDIGSYTVWKALYSTVKVNLKDIENSILLAEQFLKTGKCKWTDAQETARQINLIRDGLSRFSPDKAVYDFENLNLKAPWDGKISPVITSCGNMYTTADGRDLLVELVSLLVYSSIKEVDVFPVG